jgi:ubiquinone/menaquinone biosynthesis C-methylase UbiE
MNHIALFDRIAPVYAWFYRTQRQAYALAAQHITQRHPHGSTLVDVGCGTAALSALLSAHFTVSAVDGAQKMIDQAKRLHPETPIAFSVGNLLEGLPFADRQFDVVTASFVLHGLSPKERRIALRELARISRREVIILDYHKGRHVLIDVVEWLENGHYFSFMSSFESLIRERFTDVEIQALNATSALYYLK